MAKRTQSAGKAAADGAGGARLTVAEHGARSNDPAVHAGVAAHHGWRGEQVIAESEYAAAAAAWLRLGIDGGGDGAA